MTRYVTAAIAVMTIAASALPAAADMTEDLVADLRAAMSDDIRSPAERARDRNRRPIQTLDFFGLESDMTVIEVFPGGGWYTKLLAPVLRDRGRYIAVDGIGKAMGYGEILAGVRPLPGFEDVEIVDITDAFSPTDRGGYMALEPVDLGVTDADLALTFRNLHNLTPAGRANLYAAVHAALKSGGRFGVIDHTRRHMQPMSDEVWRRLDPVVVIKEITAAGFTFVDFSRLHHRPDDELRYEVGRRSVAGNTDRFTLLFEK